MSNKYKRRVRALAAKLNVSYQAADNIIKAGRGNGSAATSPTAVPEETPPMPTAPSSTLVEDTSAARRRVRRADVDSYTLSRVVADVAGWQALIPLPVLETVLRAVVDGVVVAGIEREITRDFGRKQPMTLRRSCLPKTGARNLKELAATARLVGHEQPRTFGDLLRLLQHLGIVTEQGERYAVPFPPPAPEETLPLTPPQRLDVMWHRSERHGKGMLREAILAEGPGFVAPAWMRAVLEQPEEDDYYDLPEFVSRLSPTFTTGVEADPALCGLMSRGFSTYLTEDPRECPCGAPIIQVWRYTDTKPIVVVIEAWCAQKHFGYIVKAVTDLCSLDPDAGKASVDRFLDGRPDDESLQAGDFYTAYVLWGIAQKIRPVSNVAFAARVMATGLYRRTGRRTGSRTYHRLPFKHMVLASPSA